MNDIIRLLPDSVANQIAAGEVIQRPASVVKELVENSVDSGATRISVIIKDAGRTLIQVVDNGSGMSMTDARLAFERHSTSKITRADDLFSLHTMGFRGEALASIAAVSTVELFTMRQGDTLGTHLVISASKVETQEPEATAPGSNMMVKNIFFNVPARRKFLKKDTVEFANILHEFERLALVNPGIELSLYHNGTLVHQLIKGPLKQRITELFGKSLDKQLIPVEVSTPIVKISGFTGHPQGARKRGALQYFFVNGRNMIHPYFRKAVMQCYEQLIAADVQPSWFLNFEVDPATIDVNIHPTKSEIKFENEQAVWQIITASVREALGRFNAAPAIDFNREDAPDIPAFDPHADAMPSAQTDPGYNPFESAGQHSHKHVPSNWGALYENPAGAGGGGSLRSSRLNDFQSEFENEPTPFAAFTPDEESVKIPSSLNFDPSPVAEAGGLMQLGGRFILSPVKSGLMVIDQHRAHILVLFSRFVEMVKANRIESQQVFFPEVLTLDATRNMVLDSIVDTVRDLGFDLAFLGDNSWAVNGVPSAIGGMNPNSVLLSIVEDVASGTETAASDVHSQVALSMARSAAIRSGQTLTHAEMETLVADLFKLPSPNYTPDGKPILQIIATEQIASRF